MALREHLERVSDGEVTTEHVFLLIVLLASVYAFIGAGEFSRGGAIFPRLTAGFTIIAVLLLLTANYFPPKYRHWLKGTSEDVMDEIEEVSDIDDVSDMEEGAPPADEEENGGEPETIVPAIPNTWAIMALIVAYVGASYLITMFWATPLFALAYAIWFRQPWYIVVSIPILTFLIAYGFGSYINFPIDDGVLIDDVFLLQVSP